VLVWKAGGIVVQKSEDRLVAEESVAVEPGIGQAR
jgi:hypothetical protein